MTSPPPGLPAAAAWAQFRRFMRLVLAATVLATAAVLAWLASTGAPAHWQYWLAVAGGTAGTVLLTGALMGLVFVSSRSGHDDSVGRGD